MLFRQLKKDKTGQEKKKSETLTESCLSGGEMNRVIINVILFLCQKKHQVQEGCQLSNSPNEFFESLGARAPPGEHQQ